jgi:hypothetical protein
MSAEARMRQCDVRDGYRPANRDGFRTVTPDSKNTVAPFGCLTRRLRRARAWMNSPVIHRAVYALVQNSR